MREHRSEHREPSGWSDVRRRRRPPAPGPMPASSPHRGPARRGRTPRGRAPPTARPGGATASPRRGSGSRDGRRRSLPRGRRRQLVSGWRARALDTATALGARPSDTSARTWATTASASEPPRRRTSMIRCSCSVADATSARPSRRPASAFRAEVRARRVRSPVEPDRSPSQTGRQMASGQLSDAARHGHSLGTRGKAPRGQPATTVAAMAEIEMPEGLYLSLSGVIRPGTGGQTRALLMRNRILTQKAGVETTLLTFDSPPVYHDVRAGLEEQGQLVPGMRLLNIFEWYRHNDGPDNEPIADVAAAAGRLRHRGRAAPRRHRLPDEVPPAARGRAAPGDRTTTADPTARSSCVRRPGRRRLDAGLAVHPRQPPGRPHAHLAEEGWLAPAVVAPARR